jgi:DNA-binding Lrp family transcriptional regulator
LIAQILAQIRGNYLPFATLERRVMGKNTTALAIREETLSEELDAIDIKILDLLQRDASLSIAEIAERVGLSSSPCWRRIERLKKSGVITGQVTLLDHEKLGLGFEVFASVKLTLPSRENLEKFESAVARWAEVVDCATVTGSADYMLRVVTRDMHAYDDFLRDKMLALGLVSDVQSRILMRVAKRTTAAPLGIISDRVSPAR